MKCKIPNKGKGFFVEGKNKIEARKRAKKHKERIPDLGKIIKITEINRECAPAFKKPWFVSVK